MRAGAVVAAGALAVTLAACGGNDGDAAPDTTATNRAGLCEGSDIAGTVTVYSGRSEKLVADFYAAFEADTGATVDVRYGDSGELAGQILTEGSATPADVFFSQDAGALGALSKAGLLRELSAEVLDRVDGDFRSDDGEWVGTSGRVRVIVYNPTLVSSPPDEIDELLLPEWKGRIGFAPTNASWQSFVTALRVIRGDDAAREWLEGFAANEPVPYEKNAAVRDAVDDGLVALGLVNHYYLYEKIAAEGAESVVAENQYMAAGDVGGLVNVAGMGVLEASDNPALAECLVSYALSDEGQTYFVERSFEYPMVAGIAQAEGLPAFDELEPPALDLSDLDTLADTQELLEDAGLLTN